MKKIATIILILMSVVAYAQEVDTTYVVNSKGQTIGIVHERGTAPVIDATVLGVQESASDPQVDVSPKFADVSGFTDDSIAYYQGLIDQRIKVGNKFRSSGKRLMLGSGLGFGLGLAFMFTAVMIDDADKHSGDDDDLELDGAEVPLFYGGYLLAVVSPGIFITGIVLKSVGNRKLRQAVEYQSILDYYRYRRSITVRLQPIVNPRSGAVGSTFTLAW